MADALLFPFSSMETARVACSHWMVAAAALCHGLCQPPNPSFPPHGSSCHAPTPYAVPPSLLTVPSCLCSVC